MAPILKLSVLSFLTIGVLVAVAARISTVHRILALQKTANHQLEDALIEAITGPLSDKWIIILMDTITDSKFDLQKVLFDVHDSVNQPLFLLSSQPGWEQQLPPPSVLKGRCAVVLIISSWPSWLEDAGDEWSPGILFVIRLNSSVFTRSLLNIPQIQRAPALALTELSYEKSIPQVYTSFPLQRDENGQRLVKNLIGSWNDRDFNTKQELFPNRFESFGGEVLHVASDLDDYPLIYENEDGLDGTNIRILNTLGDWLNFTYTTTIHAEDEMWGEFVNGSWNGLLGEVYRGEKNITVNYFTVVYERTKDFDLTSSYFYEGFGFALKIPPPLPAWMSLLYPFSLWVWISIVGLLLIIAPVLYFLTLAAPSDTASNVSLLDAVMEVFRILVRIFK
ncbi:hypothetical protein SK128_011617 [Halocaridina rubra]|uniref:Ionotropic glutamate receptor L-glutamate and glycine-binding domain-containing protein n=1 Tax=Halocaridina rubra TaxID=373956 RepID=A0AAN8XCS1_HALRR